MVTSNHYIFFTLKEVIPVALQNDPTKPTTITVTLIDENYVTVDREFIVPTSSWDPTTGLIADLKTIRDNLITELNPITNALVLKATININQTDDTSVVGPDNSRMGDQAQLTLVLDSASPKYANYLVPAAADGIFGATGKNVNVVDTSDADLLAFLEFFTTTDGVFTISDGETLDDTTLIVSGKRVYRKFKAPKPA